MNRSNTIVVCLCLLALILCMISLDIHQHPKRQEQDPFRTPYSVKVISDHEVQLSSKNDTISLFLENSGIFNNEETAFIKHK